MNEDKVVSFIDSIEQKKNSDLQAKAFQNSLKENVLMMQSVMLKMFVLLKYLKSFIQMLYRLMTNINVHIMMDYVRMYIILLRKEQMVKTLLIMWAKQSKQVQLQLKG